MSQNKMYFLENEEKFGQKTLVNSGVYFSQAISTKFSADSDPDRNRFRTKRCQQKLCTETNLFFPSTPPLGTTS